MKIIANAYFLQTQEVLTGAFLQSLDTYDSSHEPLANTCTASRLKAAKQELWNTFLFL